MTLRAFFLFAVSLLVAGLAPRDANAQVPKVEIKYLVPDVWERPTKDDDQGLKQWDEFHQNCPTCVATKTTICVHCNGMDGHTKCLECNMTKKAPCRACAGEGQLLDPLQWSLCPGCFGAGVFPCDVCGGRGGSKVEGGGDKIKDCVACKGDGGWRCGVCKGARKVPAPKLKPSVGEADSATLKKAREDVAEVLAAVSAWEPSPKARKDVKDYPKLLQKATGVLPALKLCQKDLDDRMKAIFKGEVWVGHEEREANSLKRTKQCHEYYLKFQLRLLDLCIARAEHNEKVLAEKKDK